MTLREYRTERRATLRVLAHYRAMMGYRFPLAHHIWCDSHKHARQYLAYIRSARA